MKTLSLSSFAAILVVLIGCEQEISPVAPPAPRTIDTSLIGEWVGSDTVHDGDYLRYDTIFLRVTSDSASIHAGYYKSCNRFADPNGDNIPICADYQESGAYFHDPGAGASTYEISPPNRMTIATSINLEYTRFGGDSIRVVIQDQGLQNEYGNDIVFVAKRQKAPPIATP